MTLTPPSASNFSPEVDLIFRALFFIATILVGLVWGLIIYFCIKYRRGSAAHREGSRNPTTWVEWVLSFFIFTFGLCIFIWSAQLFYRMYMPPPSALEIDVVAKQWMWVFHDQHGKDQINYFKVPLGQPVRLLMTSEDVIHSFFVPAFRIKQDVLPGRYTSAWFTATQLGSFDILCSQYCGLSHSQMRAVVEVVTPAEYENDIKGTSDSSAALDKGAELYVKHSCQACHDSAHPVGPSLHGIFGRSVFLEDGSSVISDENYLRRAILTPNAEIVAGYSPVMPTFQGRLSEEELMSLIHYLKTKR